MAGILEDFIIFTGIQNRQIFNTEKNKLNVHKKVKL